jgi:hypothetical protein
MNIPGYDAWKLEGPPEVHSVGMSLGDECGRFAEPDEDAPRGYRPRPCAGEMIDDDGYVVCDRCGEMA